MRERETRDKRMTAVCHGREKKQGVSRYARNRLDPSHDLEVDGLDAGYGAGTGHRAATILLAG